MISFLLSRVISLCLGTLYPAYASYKAVRTKNVTEYVLWMTYWIVFALFTCVETFTDLFFSWWFPLYYEIKIILLLWLLSPTTRGSSLLYRKYVHPALIQREQRIDAMLENAQIQSYNTLMELGQRGMKYITGLVMESAVRTPGLVMNAFQFGADIRVNDNMDISDDDMIPATSEQIEELNDEVDTVIMQLEPVGTAGRRRKKQVVAAKSDTFYSSAGEDDDYQPSVSTRKTKAKAVTSKKTGKVGRKNNKSDQ